MKKSLLVALAALFVATGCGPRKKVIDLQLLDDHLTFQLKISPDRENPQLINGKLSVVNSSTDFVKYGNFQLFLECDGKRAATGIKSDKATAMADTRLVHLSPGDSLGYFVAWDFGEKVNFGKAEFSLAYDNTLTTPEAQ